MSEALPEVYLARHGETAWTLTRQHTGRTDLPLTERGERNAQSLGERLRGIAFDHVLSSPLQRARRTCELAGFGDRVVVEPDLMEWDYGAYEGKTTADVKTERPDWFLFRDGCPGGESVADVGARADRLIRKLRELGGRSIVFGHAHFSRVSAARWIEQPASGASHFVLSTASLSILGFERTLQNPAILLWNDDRHVQS
jgi:broad specificity phosphatase PhoE